MGTVLFVTFLVRMGIPGGVSAKVTKRTVPIVTSLLSFMNILIIIV